MSASMRMAEQRKKIGMTQQQVAEAAGTQVQRINSLEKGHRDPTKIEVRFALRIAKALKTTVEKLFS